MLPAQWNRDQSYRPISNLQVMSKLLEWIVARQLNNYPTSTNILPSIIQSGFWPGHQWYPICWLFDWNCCFLSTLRPTAGSWRRECCCSVLLDLSAAFDTIYHSILCKRLQLTSLCSICRGGGGGAEKGGTAAACTNVPAKNKQHLAFQCLTSVVVTAVHSI